MEIVSDQTHRVLAYLDALNRHGVKPDQYWVNEFADRPDLKVERVGGLSALGTTAHLLMAFAEREVAQERYADYMARLGWVSIDERSVELTGMGRALLKALNSPAIEESADVFEVVLDPKDPFAYAQALGGLSSVKNALLVEPYFRLEQLMDVAAFDNITRVLLGSKLKAREYEVLATGLAALPDERKLEIRRALDLHDRYLIPAEDGNVVMLGSSLGGIGKKVSTMTTVGQLASRALRHVHEELWRDAEVVEPKRQQKAEAVDRTPIPEDVPPSKREKNTATEKTTGKTPAAARKSPAKRTQGPKTRE